MFGGRTVDCLLDGHQLGVDVVQADLCLTHRRADVAGDVEVEVVLLDFRHPIPAGVAGFFLSELIGVDDLLNVLRAQLVLALAFGEVLGGVDEEHVIRLLAFLEHEDADGDSGGVKKIGGLGNDSVDITVVEQLGADEETVILTRLSCPRLVEC